MCQLLSKEKITLLTCMLGVIVILFICLHVQGTRFIIIEMIVYSDVHACNHAHFVFHSFLYNYNLTRNEQLWFKVTIIINYLMGQ